MAAVVQLMGQLLYHTTVIMRDQHTIASALYHHDATSVNGTGCRVPMIVVVFLLLTAVVSVQVVVMLMLPLLIVCVSVNVQLLVPQLLVVVLFVSGTHQMMLLLTALIDDCHRGAVQLHVLVLRRVGLGKEVRVMPTLINVIVCQRFVLVEV